MKKMMYAAIVASVMMCGYAQADDMQGMNMPSGGAFDAAMAKMHQDMAKVKPTGDVDYDFVQSMIPHHQGAIDMAQVEIDQGKDLTIKQLAKNIVMTQKHEIESMQKWLMDHPKKTPAQ